MGTESALKQEAQDAITTLNQFCEQFHAMLEQNPALPQLLENGRNMLSQLVSCPDWFYSVLSGLVLDEAFLKAQRHSVDPNDIQLYLAPDKSFSVRAFIWEPGITYPIHDHGAWGIVGTHLNQIREVKYSRIDDGSNANYAEINLSGVQTLSPGGTTVVLPLDDGIHQMQSLNNLPAVSIHVYGRPIRKGFIQCFDLEKKAVTRLYPPEIYKRVLAVRTLGSIQDTWAQELLSNTLESAAPDYILQECRQALCHARGK